MKSRTPLYLVGVAALLVLANPVDAWAYIDPGSGSYLFQFLVAGLLASAYTLRRVSHTLMTTVRTWFGRPGADLPSGRDGNDGAD